MFVDTSCLVAYYIDEPKTKIVQEYLRSAKKISISQLTDIEFLSGLKKKISMGEITENKLNRVYKLYRDHKKANLFQYFMFNGKHFNNAETILRQTQHSLRTLDAIHLGIIYSENLTLFSFDEVMNETAKEFNIPVLSI